MGPPETEDLCKAKDMVNKTIWKPTKWEKLLINPTLERRLMSKIYNEFKKFVIKRTNTPIKIGYRYKQKTLNR